MTAVRTKPDERAAAPRGSAVRQRRRPADLTREDLLIAGASAASAIALAWVIFSRLTDGGSWFGFVVTAYLAFLVLYAYVTADRQGVLAAKDRVATVVVYTGAFVLMVPLVGLVGYVVARGLPALRLTFLTNDLSGVRATDPATAGGGLHAIVGTLQQVGIALILTVPLSLGTAVFLNESRSRLRRPVRIVVDAMSGLPSVVAGLFVFATLIIPFADVEVFGQRPFGYSGFMAAVALAMVMIPTVTRTVEVVLRLVPSGLREGALALGASRARVVWSVVLPTARSGLTTAIVLGVARAVGETAPLLFTAFGFDLMNTNPFNGPQDSLPLFVYKNILKPSEASVDRAFAGALVLMLIVLSLFAIARFIGRDRSTRRTPSRLTRIRRRPRPDRSAAEEGADR